MTPERWKLFTQYVRRQLQLEGGDVTSPVAFVDAMGRYVDDLLEGRDEDMTLLLEDEELERLLAQDTEEDRKRDGRKARIAALQARPPREEPLRGTNR